MKRRWRIVLAGLGFAILLAMIFLGSRREEPSYQGKPLSYWVIRLGSDEIHGAPEDAVSAIRAIGPKAVPFLLDWMPHRRAWSTRVREWCSELLHISTQHREGGTPDSLCVGIAWWALGTEGKSAIPALARIIKQPLGSRDDYSAWTASAKAISYLGPDAIAPMLTAATNMQGRDELWQLIHNFGNLGTNGAPAIPALLQWTNHPYYFVRAAVANALGGIERRPDLAVPVLLAALNDSDSMVRRDAAEALGAFADDSDAVLPALIKTIHGDDSEARGGALSGLGRIRSKPEIVIPLIAPYLSDENSVVARSAAYALRGLGRAGVLALLRTTNEVPGVMGIADIVYQAAESLSGPDEEKRRKEIVAKLAASYAIGESTRVPDLVVEGKSLAQILNSQENAGSPLRLDQMLTLQRLFTEGDADTAIFELPIEYEALTNIGTLRLLCDADPTERAGNEALIQECQRATNGNCLLLWNTSFDPPGQHFLQAEIVLSQRDGNLREDNHTKKMIPLRGPLFSFVSTNVIQFFPHTDSYTDHGAYFRAKLAQPIGSYSLKLTTISGQQIHTITGSTTNGIAEVFWDLLYDRGKRFTGESFNATWAVTFPGQAQSAGTNSTATQCQPR